MLEGGDRAANIGEGGLEMGEDLGGRLACGIRRRPGRRLGRRAAPAQGGADVALCPVEAFPDALQSAIAQAAIDGAAGRDQAAGDGGLQEPPQAPSVRLSRRILSASQTLKVRPQPGRAWRLLQKTRRARSVFCRGLALVGSVQTAVLIQRADDLAMRTRRLLEPFHNRRHSPSSRKNQHSSPTGSTPSRKSSILPGRGGVKAGYD